MLSIDDKIEISKLIQQIFLNCYEGEVYIGLDAYCKWIDDRYQSKLELHNIKCAIQNTIDNLVNEKLRTET